MSKRKLSSKLSPADSGVHVKNARISLNTVNIKFCGKNYKLQVINGDYISAHIKKYNSFYEIAISYFIHCLGRASAAEVAVDVGGFIGDTAIIMASYYKHVYVFEPMPSLYDVAAQNIQLNNANNITLFGLAVSDQAGVTEINENLELNEGKLHFGAIKVKTHYTGKSAEPRAAKTALPVKTITLDEFLPSRHRISLIKVDVEGFESHVIRGALGVIRAHKPVIIYEHNDRTLHKEKHLLEYLSEEYRYLIYLPHDNYAVLTEEYFSILIKTEFADVIVPDNIDSLERGLGKILTKYHTKKQIQYIKWQYTTYVTMVKNIYDK